MFGRGGRGGGALYGEFKPSDEPTDLYPKVAGMPIQENVTELEQQGVAQFLQLRNEIRDGPFYLGAAPKHKDKEGKVVENVGPAGPTADGRLADGIKRYTDRYRERQKAGKLLSEHPFILELFPSELHGVLGASTGVVDDNKKVKGRKKLEKKLALGTFAGGITSSDVYRQSFGQDIDAGGEDNKKANGDNSQDRQSNLAMAFAQLDDNGGAGEGADDDDGEEEEEVEDDFDEDEEGDYNAEQYFDDGNDDYDEDDAGDDEAAY